MAFRVWVVGAYWFMVSGLMGFRVLSLSLCCLGLWVHGFRLDPMKFGVSPGTLKGAPKETSEGAFKGTLNPKP